MRYDHDREIWSKTPLIFFGMKTRNSVPTHSTLLTRGVCPVTRKEATPIRNHHLPDVLALLLGTGWSLLEVVLKPPHL
jgi:hypothetical protein